MPGASGADAERAKRIRSATPAGAAVSASSPMMAGTRLSQVTSWAAAIAQNRRREKRLSTTSELPATSVDRTPTTSPLMWNSGSGQ